MSGWYGDLPTKNAKYISVQELKELMELVKHKDLISNSLGQQIANAEQEITDCLEILNVLDPEYAERLKQGLRETLERL